MDDLRGKYRVQYRDLELQVGSNSAVLSQTFVAEALEREERRDDGLGAFRGAVNALLISLVFWVALGLVLFTHF
jgi:hypothetical protein